MKKRKEKWTFALWTRKDSLRGGWGVLGVLVLRGFLVHQVLRQTLEGLEIPAGFKVEDEITPTGLAAILTLMEQLVAVS